MNMNMDAVASEVVHVAHSAGEPDFTTAVATGDRTGMASRSSVGGHGSNLWP